MSWDRDRAHFEALLRRFSQTVQDRLLPTAFGMWKTVNGRVGHWAPGAVHHSCSANNPRVSYVLRPESDLGRQRAQNERQQRLRGKKVRSGYVREAASPEVFIWGKGYDMKGDRVTPFDSCSRSQMRGKMDEWWEVLAFGSMGCLKGSELALTRASCFGGFQAEARGPPILPCMAGIISEVPMSH